MKSKPKTRPIQTPVELHDALKALKAATGTSLEVLHAEALRCGMEFKRWIERKSEEKQ